MNYYKVTDDRAFTKKLGGLVKGEIFTGKEVLEYEVPLYCIRQVHLAPAKTVRNFGVRREIRSIV
jgi:hypothetical protein